MERSQFVETSTYTKALEILESKKIVILSGHPGEGKTSMANHLLKRYPAGRCINLTEPKQWDHLDFSLNLIDAILIDDIFGSGVLDENLVKQWRGKLDDMSRIVKGKNVNVVITSRHYILEETKQLFRSLPLFKKENIQLLSSKDLTHEEKMQILETHLKAERRPVKPEEMAMCVMMHASVLENILFGTNEFLFGFPECVNLFARQNDLFNEGPNFFSQPNKFVKSCIKQLYENEEKFLALIVMWANKNHTLKKYDLDESNLSHRLSKIAKKFKFKMKGKLIKKLRKSLDHHVGGLLHFSRESGTYSFNHNVICDMVGLVIAEENPDEVLEFCTREFLLTYVTTESTDDEFKFCVDEYLFKDLAKQLMNLMIDEKSLLGLLDCSFSINSLNRGGKMRSRVKPSFNFDVNIVKCESFQNDRFVDVFLDELVKKGNIESIIGTEIMELSGFFLRYGLKVSQQKYFLLSYSVFIGAEMFAKRVAVRNLLDRTELTNDQKAREYTMALFFAVHHQMSSLVECLLQKDVVVTDEALYIAAHRPDMKILKLLLGKMQCKRELHDVEILNGNNALIVAAKKGFANAVQCFIACGYNLTARNKDGLTALDKAIAYGHEDVCELLVNEGVPVNERTRKFKRRPIHTAIDKGLLSATKCLLANGGTLSTRDHKGFYPIHTAALNRHFEIVRYLLQHDPSQAALLTKTYGAKSVLKGKSVFHIALYKHDMELLEVLLSTKANPNVTDWYGRTVFLEAILKGELVFINRLKGIANMTIPDKNGFTPLHVAVYKGYISLVHITCSNPTVNVNAMDKFGKTPLHVSAIKGFGEIFLVLVFLYNADWRMVTKRGDTIMHLAVRQRRLQDDFSLTESMQDTTVTHEMDTDDANSVHNATAGSNAIDADNADNVQNTTSGANAKGEDDTNSLQNITDIANEMDVDDANIVQSINGDPNKMGADDVNNVQNTTDGANAMDVDDAGNVQNATSGADANDADDANIVQNTTACPYEMDTNDANSLQNNTDIANEMDAGDADLVQSITGGANKRDSQNANIVQNASDSLMRMTSDDAHLVQNTTDRVNEMDSYDPNAELRNLIRHRFLETTHPNNSQLAEGHSTYHAQDDIPSLDVCGTTTRDYNLIISILSTLDNDFLEKMLPNKYGERIIVGTKK